MVKTFEKIPGVFTGTFTGYPASKQNIRFGTSNLNYNRTVLKTIQHEKIKICSDFIKAFSETDFFDKSFTTYNSTINGCNLAASILMSQALKGNHPFIYLSYPQVMISKGKLPAAQHAAATLINNKNIYFSFTDNSDTGSASYTDKLILVAYAEDLQQAVFTLNGGLRKNCEAVLNAGIFRGYAVHTWIGFLSSNDKEASNSIYTGKIDL